MVADRSEYKFVTGDIGLVEIDGGIMPLRSGTARNSLRGVDICFLLEGVRERWAAGNFIDSPTAGGFSRSLSTGDPNEVAGFFEPVGSFYQDLRDNSSAYLNAALWVKRGASFANFAYGDTEYAPYEDNWGRLLVNHYSSPSSKFFTPADFSGYNYGFRFASGDALLASRIDGLFTDLYNVKRFLYPLRWSVAGGAGDGSLYVKYTGDADATTASGISFQHDQCRWCTLTDVLLFSEMTRFGNDFEWMGVMRSVDPSGESGASLSSAIISDAGLSPEPDPDNVWGFVAIYPVAAFGVFEIGSRTLW